MSALQFRRTAAIDLAGELLGVRCVFTVQKEMIDSGGSMELKAYNLSPAHRNTAEITDQKHNVLLYAGYGGQNKLLYNGPIFYAKTERIEADLVTTFSAMGGAFALSAVFVVLEGISNDYEAYQAVLTAFKPFGVARGHLSQAVIQKLQNNTHKAKYSNVDTAAGVMNIITRRAGLRWNPDDGTLNIYADNEYQDQEMILLDKNTGLVGVPSKTKEKNYKVKALLNGDLRPGRRIRVQSEEFPIDGDLRIIKCTHSGDSKPLTARAEWYTEMECTILGTAPGFSAVS